MDSVIVVVAVIVLVALAAVAVMWWRSESLKRRFGPEYDRVVDETGDRRAAEAALRDRAKRRDSVEVRELSSEARDRFEARWLDVQSSFVDDPRRAVAAADALVRAVMRERGYPADGFDESLEMVSVDSPELAERLRRAHALQQGDGGGSDTTENLRDAFQIHRELFEDLIDDGHHRSDRIVRDVGDDADRDRDRDDGDDEYDEDEDPREAGHEATPSKTADDR
jgi:hypothetical protein